MHWNTKAIQCSGEMNTTNEGIYQLTINFYFWLLNIHACIFTHHTKEEEISPSLSILFLKYKGNLSYHNVIN